jgi:hypothetical protein
MSGHEVGPRRRAFARDGTIGYATLTDTGQQLFTELPRVAHAATLARAG